MMLAANPVVFGLEIPDSDLGLRSNAELPQLLGFTYYTQQTTRELMMM